MTRRRASRSSRRRRICLCNSFLFPSIHPLMASNKKQSKTERGKGIMEEKSDGVGDECDWRQPGSKS